MWKKFGDAVTVLTRRILASKPDPSRPLLTLEAQIKAWRRANLKMGRLIPQEEFERIGPAPAPTSEELSQGYIDAILCHGFGDNGAGASDPVLSGKLAWEYALKRRKGRIWQCEYADFNRPQDIRLRPDAPPRPRGFYFARFNPGVENKPLPVAKVRKRLTEATGLGPEGFQLLCITHPHLADLMNERKFPFIALADYDIAPHGFNDFFECPQLFCSQGILGFGVGNVDGPYPLFAIPSIRF
jgi:hypothetical protein